MDDKCVICGEEVPEGRHVCPICNREYEKRAAMSRADNQMSICPECGVREAIRAAGRYNGLSREEIVKAEEQVIAMIREIQEG